MAIMDFNYNKAINQARQIDNIAQEMTNAADSQMKEICDSIGSCWKGESSTQFMDSLKATQSDIRAHAKKLNNLAQKIRRVATILEEAEQRAKEVQRRRDALIRNTNSGGGGGGGW